MIHIHARARMAAFRLAVPVALAATPKALLRSVLESALHAYRLSAVQVHNDSMKKNSSFNNPGWFGFRPPLASPPKPVVRLCFLLGRYEI